MYHSKVLIKKNIKQKCVKLRKNKKKFTDNFLKSF